MLSRTHDRRPLRPSSIAAAAMLLAPLSLSAQAPKMTAASNSSATALNAARSALDKYKDPIAAVRDGYLSTVGCIAFPTGAADGTMQYKPGGMGVHFINMQNVGPKLDPAKPQVLIYQPVGDKLVLAAAEWFMPVEVAGNTRPAIFGKELEGPMEGHTPIMPAGLHHYDLHVWLWKENPLGVFSPTNPSVKCPKGAAYSYDDAPPKMVHMKQ